MAQTDHEPEYLRTGLPCYDYQKKGPGPGGGDSTHAGTAKLLSVVPAAALVVFLGLKTLFGVERLLEIPVVLALAYLCIRIMLTGNAVHGFAGVLLLAVVLLAAGFAHDVQEKLELGWIPYWIGILVLLAITYASIGIGAAVGNAVDEAVDEGYGRR